MKKNVITFSVFALIVLIATLTNPDQDRHKEVLKNKLNAYMQQSMKDLANSTDEWEQAGNALALMLGGELVDQIIDNIVSTDNYVLFSLTKITWDGETKVIGIGVFGNVFMTKELDRTLNERIA